MTDNIFAPLLAGELEEQARQRLEEFRAACRKIGCKPNLSASGEQILKQAFVFSNFVLRTTRADPLCLATLLESGLTQHANQAGALLHQLESRVQPGDQPTLFSGLRKFRKQQMLRIAICDLGGLMKLETVMEQLSLVAETCLKVAADNLFRILAARFGCPEDKNGRPVLPVILALGKLGGRELNFSSDIDLIFAYDREGQTAGAGPSISNEDFFQRFFRQLIQAIGSPGADGLVFRVDTRLRPFGEVGPLAMSFARMEDYYQRQGRQWERYALIKARTVAGDLAAGNRLLESLKPFVYRRYLDYGLFDALREMKAKIMAEVKSKGLENDIKLGPGGIREIEFFGQVFQLLRGGVQPAFQKRSIQAVLASLADHRAIDRQTAEDLLAAYRFLRSVENRLQQWADQQTHRLPTDEKARLRLACSLGFRSTADFETALELHRSNVQRHFELLLHDDRKKREISGPDRILAEICRETSGSPNAEQALSELGYTDPGRVLDCLAGLHASAGIRSLSQAGRIRLFQLLPLIVKDVAEMAKSEPELVFSRLTDLLANIQGRVPYLSLLIESPTARAHLIRLAAASSWIARFVARHPVLLDELMDPRSLYEPATRASLVRDLERQMEAIDPEDLEQQMDALRVFKQVNTLRVAAADITDVLPLMKVSDRLSDLAETILDKVLDLCWHQLAERYGRPLTALDGRPCNRGFAVVAYGKLGGLELGYGSDLDLVFLHAADKASTRGKHPVDSTHFYTRLGQRVLHMLTAHTTAGILYQSDMRLRPSGDSGLLVSHLKSFADYQFGKAWTWEHQALVRARAVVGDPALIGAFEKIRRQVITMERDPDKLLAEVVAMRDRLRRANDKSADGKFDLKQGFGGMVDIEFMVQYLILKHAHKYRRLAQWTDNVRLLRSLAAYGIIDQHMAYFLRRAYLVYRALAHRCNLQERPAMISGDHLAGLRRSVQVAWHRYLR